MINTDKHYYWTRQITLYDKMPVMKLFHNWTTMPIARMKVKKWKTCLNPGDLRNWLESDYMRRIHK